MVDRNDSHGSPDRERSAGAEPPNRPRRTTEDVVFPESYRKFWRLLLGPWGRR
ncbi:hypothetical protein ACXDF8_17735 [Mycolicibacterium sp. CBM1]